MGKRMSEAFWVVFKRRAIKLRYWCICLVDLFEWKLSMSVVPWRNEKLIFDISSATPNKTATSLIDDFNINKTSCHPSSRFLLQTLWFTQPGWLKMDEVSPCLIIPDSKLWLHSWERALFYRKINHIPSAATHGACTKIFWNLINCTNFYDAEISWLLRLNVVMNKWMRERVRKEKYYMQAGGTWPWTVQEYINLLAPEFYI
jgi:hypothetical protein